MRVAQVGVGRIGQQHAEVLANHDGVDQLVVADADRSRADDVARRLGVAAMDVDEAMDAADALVIAAATDAHPSLIRAGIEPAWDSFLERFREAYRNELSAFVDVARGMASSACTARDGLEAMRIAEAASRSVEERRVVALDEVNVLGEKEVPA